VYKLFSSSVWDFQSLYCFIFATSSIILSHCINIVKTFYFTVAYQVFHEWKSAPMFYLCLYSSKDRRKSKIFWLEWRSHFLGSVFCIVRTEYTEQTLGFERNSFNVDCTLGTGLQTEMKFYATFADQFMIEIKSHCNGCASLATFIKSFHAYRILNKAISEINYAQTTRCLLSNKFICRHWMTSFFVHYKFDS
jgi:hypothetical protein